jgi:Mn2+/Fe2+ NRAMP family transporter
LASRSNLWKALGPGILVACAAIGGSHLVWSTRAGAEFGWSLLWLVLMANLLKFPFFFYGQRYTAATGDSLLAGYKRLGIGYVWVFLTINILTGTINIAGVSMLSGALLSGYGITAISVPHLTVTLLIICGALLLVGHYKVLDNLAKLIIIALSISTILAVILALQNQSEIPVDFVTPSPYQWASFAFIISLLGWMPAPIDLSAWSSLWMFSREKQTGHVATVKESSIDFYIGYLAAVVLATLFVALGVLVMHGSGESFSAGGVGFAKQLVSLYTSSIGEWSHLLILSAAFITMFSTSLTCLDGYPRSFAACSSLIKDLSTQKFQRIQNFWMILSTIFASLVVLLFAKSLIQLLSFAAIVSFITSPVLAYINYRVMCGENVPKKFQPGILMKILSWAGIAFFTLMSFAYLYLRFFS